MYFAAKWIAFSVLVAPEFALTAAYYVFYYVFVVAALIGIISLVYFINRRLHAEKKFIESESSKMIFAELLH